MHRRLIASIKMMVTIPIQWIIVLASSTCVRMEILIILLVLSKEQFSAQPLIVVNTATKSRLATQTQMPLDAHLADQLAQQIFQQGTAVFAQQRRAN